MQNIIAPIGSTPSGGRNSQPVNANPSRAVMVSSVGGADSGPLLGSRSMRSHSLVRGSTSSTVRGLSGLSTVIATMEPPALMVSSEATMPGSGIGSCKV